MSNTILVVPEWLPYGETQHVTGDNDPVYGVNGTINRCPKTLWQHMQALGVGIDTLQVQYVSASSVKVLAGGVCWADDGEQGYQLDTDIIVSLSSLSASSAYFLWIGEESSAIAVKVGSAFDDSTVPSGLTHAHRIPGWFLTDGSGNVTQFSTSFLPGPRTGELIEWAGRYAPYGTLFANGGAWTRTGAPFDRGYALFDTAFGVGDGSTTYNIPDKQGRCGIGAGSGSGLTARTLGQTLGEEAHALTEDENASHAHYVSLFDKGDGFGTDYVAPIGYASSYLGTQVTVTSGNSIPHNTVQPSLVFNYVLAL